MAKGIRWRGTAWELRVTHEGQQLSKTAKHPKDDAGLRRAIKDREQWILELNGDGVKADLPHFWELAQDFLDSHSIDETTRDGYKRILNRVWIPTIGAKRIDLIKPSHIKAALNKHDVSVKTKQNYMHPASGVFELAIEDDLLERNPVLVVKLKGHQKEAIDRYTRAERDKIMGKLSGDAWLFYLVAFETGMRPGEILALDWEDIGPDVINVSKAFSRGRLKSTKNYHRRSVQMSSLLKKHLHSHPARFKGGPLWMHDKGRHCWPKPFNKAWTDALKAARMTYRKPYHCRHTRASEMLTAGLDHGYCARQLGHSLQVFMNIYAEWIDGLKDAEQQAKLEQFQQFLGQEKGTAS